MTRAIAKAAKRVRHSPFQTCPICSDPIPARPSEHLAYLLRLARRGTDDVILEQSICRRHEAEKSFAEAIRHNKCPKSIDFDALRLRLIDFLPHMIKYVRSEKESPFLEAAMSRHRRGLPLLHMQPGVSGQMMTVNDTLVGYYGEKGQLIMTRILDQQIESTGLLSLEMTAPFYSIQEFTRYVLVPEAAIFLIRQDYPWMSWTDADERRKKSTEWGLILGENENDEDDGSRHSDDDSSSEPRSSQSKRARTEVYESDDPDNPD